MGSEACDCHSIAKKSLKTPKGQSEATNRRTNYTMAKRKLYKMTKTMHKTLHRKPNIEEHEPHSKPGVNLGALEQ